MLGRSQHRLFSKKNVSLNPQVRNELNGDTLLIHAARNGLIDQVKFLLKKFKHDIDINATNLNNISAVAAAAAFGHLDIVDCLIQQGVNIKERNEKMLSPLDLAAANGQLAMVQHLVPKHIKHSKDIYLAIRHALDGADEKMENQRIATAEFLLTYFVQHNGFKNITNTELTELVADLANYPNIEISEAKNQHVRP
ncbi:MAG: ankyrin repeat domain-containing protein [Gammaproteobacteria bacterium]